MKWGGGGEARYLSVVLEDTARKLIENGYVSQSAEIMQLSDMDDETFSFYMDLFIECILKMYRKEQIILVDCQAVPYSVNEARDSVNLFEQGQIEKWYVNINRGYRYLRKQLAGCHVIEFPKGVFGDESHKWGRAPLHYIPEYYDYGLKAVDIITQGRLPYEEEREKLRELRERYEDLMKLKYEPIYTRTFQFLKVRDGICTRMTVYEKYMKDLLLHDGKLLWACNFMREKRFSHCAFYGLTELGMFWIKFFKRWGIQIDYIVDDTKNSTYEGIPCIAKKEQSYPETQVMIIAEVLLADKIKEKLKKLKVSCPYYDVYEILQ